MDYTWCLEYLGDEQQFAPCCLHTLACASKVIALKVLLHYLYKEVQDLPTPQMLVEGYWYTTHLRGPSYRSRSTPARANRLRWH